MKYIPLVIAFLLFGYGAYIRVKPTAPTVISQSAEVLPSPSPSSTTQPLVTASPSPIVIPLPTTVPTSVPQTSTTTQFIYPGVHQIGDGMYQTSTDGKTVFEWYKSQLTAAGFHIGVSVSSSANDVFKGVLQATKAGETLNILIEQPKANQKTKITISN